MTPGTGRRLLRGRKSRPLISSGTVASAVYALRLVTRRQDPALIRPCGCRADPIVFGHTCDTVSGEPKRGRHLTSAELRTLRAP